MTSGYDGNSGKDASETPIPSPSSRIWKVELDHKNNSSEKDVVFARVEVDREVVGFLRLPNAEHLTWLRERLQEK